MKHKHGGLGVKKLLYKCARASTVEYFNIQLERLKEKKYGAWSWLQRKGSDPIHWSKAYFSTTCKSDIYTNNNVEIFNKFILEARSMPILEMFEKIRVLIQKRIRTNRDAMLRYPGTLCPRIVLKLDKNRKFASGFICHWSGGARFEVSSAVHKVVVDLRARTCDCRLWQLTGIPCSHALCAILMKADDPDDFVHECYHTSKYLKTYENLIEPVCGPELWEHSYKQPLLEPIVTTQPGRPKKKRNKASDEPTTSGKLKKSRVSVNLKCGSCGESGHNKRTCKGRENNASTSTAN